MIYTINGTQYRVMKQDGLWRAAVWCDCILGPHWHEGARNASKRELLVELALYTPQVQSLNFTGAQ
jgi:hypothetical protein